MEGQFPDGHASQEKYVGGPDSDSPTLVVGHHAVLTMMMSISMCGSLCQALVELQTANTVDIEAAKSSFPRHGSHVLIHSCR